MDIFGFGQMFSAGASMAAAEATAASNERINERQLQWQEDMWHKQNERDDMLYDKQLQDTYDLRDYDNQKQVEFWNMQNQYNDPSAQVARLRAAGINPYMDSSAVGSGVSSSVGSASSASAPSPISNTVPSSPNLRSTDYSPYIAAFSQMAKAFSEVGNTDADTKFKNENTRGQKLQNDFFEGVKDFRKQLEELGIDIAKGTRDNLLQDKLNKAAARDIMNLDKKEKEIALKYFDENQLLEHYKLRYELVGQILSNADTFAGINLKNSSLKEIEERVKLIYQQRRGLQIDNDIKDDTKESTIKSINQRNNADAADDKNREYVAGIRYDERDEVNGFLRQIDKLVIHQASSAFYSSELLRKKNAGTNDPEKNDYVETLLQITDFLGTVTGNLVGPAAPLIKYGASGK